MTVAIVLVVLTLGVRFSGVLEGKVPERIQKLREEAALRESLTALPECPSTMNCVLSKERPTADTEGTVKFEDHSSEEGPLTAWSLKGNPEQTKALIRGLLEKKSQARLTAEGPRYLQYEFKTPIMGYVDDVEFLVTDTQVHFRSSSRIGKSDLGANRKRLLDVEFLYHQTSGI